MMETRCSICGSDHYVPVSQRDAYFSCVRNVICTHCGLVYLNPIMTPEETAEYYSRYRIAGIGLYEPDARFLDLADRLGRMRLRHIAEFLTPGAKVLDVGCGHGYILKLAQQRGCVGVGVEPDPGFSEYARRTYGLRVYTGLFENVDLSEEDGTFDVVTFQHTFEHFRDPVSLLRRVRLLLKKGGIVNMDMPNLDTPRGGFLWQDLYLEHTQTYTPRTINLLLRKTGFQIIKLDTKGYVTTEKHHVPLMNLVATKCAPEPDIDYARDGDDYRRILFRLMAYRLKHLIRGGWRFYLVNLPLQVEEVRIQGRNHQGPEWANPLRHVIPPVFRTRLTRLLRKLMRPYRFVDFSLPPARDYSIS